MSIIVGDRVEPITKHESSRVSLTDPLHSGCDLEVVKVYKDKDCGLSMVSVKAVGHSHIYPTHYNYPLEFFKKKI